MGIRNNVNNAPTVATIAAIVFFAAIAAVLWVELRRPPVPDTSDAQFYYTVDDGKSYFADLATRITPFDHEGKQAVRAVVFACDEKKSGKFVGFLQRLDPAKGSADIKPASYQVRRPGEEKWVSLVSPEGTKIRNVTCPGGGNTPPREVTP